MSRFRSIPTMVLAYALLSVFWCFAALVLPFSAAYYGIRIGWKVAKDEVLK